MSSQIMVGLGLDGCRTPASPEELDRSYASLEKAVAVRLADMHAIMRAAGGLAPLFTTSADPQELWHDYLHSLPSDNRQHYNCMCCKSFVKRFGGLVTISSDGEVHPAVWPAESGTPEPFRRAVRRIKDRLNAAMVTGVFLTEEKTLGTPSNLQLSGFMNRRTWTHLHATNPAPFASPVKTAEQEMAEKREDYRMLRTALDSLDGELLGQAVRVLESEALDRSEKAVGIARWLYALYNSLVPYARGSGHRRKGGDLNLTSKGHNLVWLAVAKAPAGWCHVSSTMIGTLLDDLRAGLPFEEVRRRWAAKMHPLRYRRTETVSAGNVEQANRIVDLLQSSGSLARRFALLQELTTFWKPAKPKPISLPPYSRGLRRPGIFDHLIPKPPAARDVQLPNAVMTWQKFRRTVLDDAREPVTKLEVSVPDGRGPFFGMVTATNAAAPPLFQWDNPVSCYFYHGGSPASQWNLAPHAWTKVNAICASPAHWENPERNSHHPEVAHLILDGARDLHYSNGGAFFTEDLRSEYHSVRKSMEAYAANAAIGGKLSATACGVAYQNGSKYQLRLRVTTDAGTACYTIDRWD